MNYNPMLDYQRNQLLAQQNMIQNQLNQLNSQRQTFNPYPNQSEQFLTRQVGSIEEVKAYPVEPGMMYLFPDTGTGDIYLKRLNTDNGKSEIITYKPHSEVKKMNTDHTPSESDIATRLDSIEKKIGDIYESISSTKLYEKSDKCDAATNATKDAEVKSSEVQSDSTNVEW